MKKNITLTEEKIINITDIIGAGMSTFLPYLPLTLRSSLTEAVAEVSALMTTDIINVLTGGLDADEIKTVGNALMNKASNEMTKVIAEIDDESDIDDAMDMLCQLMSENSDVLERLKNR